MTPFINYKKVVPILCQKLPAQRQIPGAATLCLEQDITAESPSRRQHT